LDALLPRRTVWLDLMGMASERDGWAARGELGARLGQYAAGFIAGTVTPSDKRVEAGVRVTF